MKQVQLIEKYNTLFGKIKGIQSVIIIGSFGRKNPKANSDIDYQILVDENFDNDLFFKKIKLFFANELKHSLFLENKNKWCFYLTDDYIITELFICTRLQELDKYYLGSEISNPNDAIIFDKTNTVFKYFQKITQEKEKQFNEIQKTKVEYLMTDFQNRFEACSNAHAKSDGYKFSVLFSHGLNAVVRLIYLCKGANEHDYMPPNFLTDYSYKFDLKIEELGTMDLRLANSHKRKLLDLFLEYMPIALDKFNIKTNEGSIISFLENIFKRDFFWNFRDISKFNSKIRQGAIYRSSALCLYKEDLRLNVILEKYNITSIIDLRADRELKECNYNNDQKLKFNIVHAPFDHWAQSVEFQNTYNTGTNAEIAYQFFSLECKSSIKKVIEIVLNSKGAVDIHCHAGKDRTGIVIALFHLLSGADENEIFLDYFASEMDTQKSYLQIFLDTVRNTGGIDKYLQTCKLTEMQIDKLKYKICE
jgi:protein tyrosine/serine phosphatase/predicted nucleotidyltransferase